MRISNTDDFSVVPWFEYSEESTWLFPEGEGMKTLFVQVMDGAGLITSLDATVIMDTTAPTGTFSFEGGTTTRSSLVTLTLDFEDEFGLDVARVSNAVDFEEAQWVEYSPTMSWDLVEEGERIVYLEVRDKAGNVAKRDRSILYDETPPVIEFISPK